MASIATGQNSEVLRLVIRAVNEASGVFNRVGTDFRAMATTISNFAGKAIVGLTALADVIMFKAGKAFADFDNQIRRVGLISEAIIGGKVTPEFEKLRAVALKLGETTIFDSVTVAQGMETLAQAGLGANQILSAMPGILNAAVASGESLATTMDLMVSTMFQFDLGATEMTRVADTMTVAAIESVASMSSLGEALKFVGPFAHELNITLEDTVSMIGQLSNVGLQGTLAGTGLRQSLNLLVTGVKRVTDFMKGYGVSIRDTSGEVRNIIDLQIELAGKGASVSAAIAAFGSRAGIAFGSLLSDIGRSVAKMREFTKSGAALPDEIVKRVGVLKKVFVKEFLEMGQSASDAMLHATARANALAFSNIGRIRAAIELGKGKAQEIMDGLVKQWGGSLKRMQSVLQNVFVALGGVMSEALLPVINEKIIPALQKLSKSMTTNSELKRAFADLGTLISKVFDKLSSPEGMRAFISFLSDIIRLSVAVKDFMSTLVGWLFRINQIISDLSFGFLNLTKVLIAAFLMSPLITFTSGIWNLAKAFIGVEVAAKAASAAQGLAVGVGSAVGASAAAFAAPATKDALSAARLQNAMIGADIMAGYKGSGTKASMRAYQESQKLIMEANAAMLLQGSRTAEVMAAGAKASGFFNKAMLGVSAAFTGILRILTGPIGLILALMGMSKVISDMRDKARQAAITPITGIDERLTRSASSAMEGELRNTGLADNDSWWRKALAGIAAVGNPWFDKTTQSADDAEALNRELAVADRMAKDIRKQYPAIASQFNDELMKLVDAPNYSGNITTDVVNTAFIRAMGAFDTAKKTMEEDAEKIKQAILDAGSVTDDFNKSVDTFAKNLSAAFLELAPIFRDARQQFQDGVDAMIDSISDSVAETSELLIKLKDEWRKAGMSEEAIAEQTKIMTASKATEEYEQLAKQVNKFREFALDASTGNFSLDKLTAGSKEDTAKHLADLENAQAALLSFRNTLPTVSAAWTAMYQDGGEYARLMATNAESLGESLDSMLTSDNLQILREFATLGMSLADAIRLLQERSEKGSFIGPEMAAETKALADAVTLLFSTPGYKPAIDLKASFDSVHGSINAIYEATKVLGGSVEQTVLSQLNRLDAGVKDTLASIMNSLAQIQGVNMGAVQNALAPIDATGVVPSVTVGALGSALGNVLRGGFQAFAQGGIARKPTLGLVGEGRYNEAIVPLPDGRSIPVNMRGGQNTPIEVTVVNVLDPSLIDARIMANGRTIINMIGQDATRGGKMKHILQGAR